MILTYLFLLMIISISLIWLPMILYDAIKQMIDQYKVDPTIDMIMVDIIGILMTEVILFILLFNHVVEILHKF